VLSKTVDERIDLGRGEIKRRERRERGRERSKEGPKKHKKHAKTSDNNQRPPTRQRGGELTVNSKETSQAYLTTQTK
jgi:hypothetical protein